MEQATAAPGEKREGVSEFLGDISATSAALQMMYDQGYAAGVRDAIRVLQKWSTTPETAS